MKRVITAAILSLLLLGFSAVNSDAGVKTIYPDQLTPVSNDFFIIRPQTLLNLTRRTISPSFMQG